MKITRLLFFFGLLFTAGLTYAQTDFRPGYVVKLSGDTLSGEVDYRSSLLMGSKCKFRTKDTGNEVEYSPGEITSFRFKDSRYFVSREVNEKTVFLEFLITGQINIYYLVDDKGEHYFLEKTSTGIIEIPYEEDYRYKNDIRYLYRSTKHVGLLNYYTMDAPDLQSRISKMQKPEHKNLIKLAGDYHTETSKDGSSYIVYEQKTPWVKIELEFNGGAVKYQNSEAAGDKFYFQGGILAHFATPRVTEKLFLRTGLLYSTVKFENEKKSAFKIPVHIEYKFPAGIVRPAIALGINVYQPFYQTVAVMGGVNIKFSKSVHLAINYDIDFEPSEKSPVVPNNVFSQSVSTGLLWKL